jgi:hypothetical protein
VAPIAGAVLAAGIHRVLREPEEEIAVDVDPALTAASPEVVPAEG